MNEQHVIYKKFVLNNKLNWFNTWEVHSSVIIHDWRSIQLNLDGCSLGTLRQLEIGRVIRDHWGLVVKAYSKPAGVGFSIEIQIVVLLEGLMQTKASGLSNFVVQGNSTIVILWVAKKEIDS